MGKGSDPLPNSNISVADNVILKAGDSPDPTEVIPHASLTTDISSSLAGKRYVTAETVEPEVPFPVESVGVCSWSWATIPVGTDPV